MGRIEKWDRLAPRAAGLAWANPLRAPLRYRIKLAFELVPVPLTLGAVALLAWGAFAALALAGHVTVQ